MLLPESFEFAGVYGNKTPCLWEYKQPKLFYKGNQANVKQIITLTLMCCHPIGKRHLSSASAHRQFSAVSKTEP